MTEQKFIDALTNVSNPLPTEVKNVLNSFHESEISANAAIERFEKSFCWHEIDPSGEIYWHTLEIIGIEKLREDNPGYAIRVHQYCKKASIAQQDLGVEVGFLILTPPKERTVWDNIWEEYSDLRREREGY